MAKRFLGFIFSVVVLVTLAACTPEQADTIKIAYQKIPNSLAVTKASEKLEQMGYEIEWLEFSSGAEVNSAFASGSVDIGVVGSNPFAVGVAQGLDYELIMVHEILGAAEALVSKEGSSDIAGLKNTTIATPFSSTAHFSLIKAIESMGLQPEEFNLVDMQPGDILAAWEGGSIDSAYVWDPILSRLKTGGGSVIVDSEDVSNMGFPTSNLAVVSSAFAERNPAFVSDYVAAQLEANALLHLGDSGAVELLSNEFDISVEDVRNQISGMSFPSKSEQVKSGSFVVAAALKSSLDFLFEQGSIQEVPDSNVIANKLNISFLEN